MKKYITIDGGTSNTRIHLVCGESILGTVSLSIGARIGIDNKSALKEQIKNGIAKLLDDAALSSCDIEKIIASGMITSELGLYETPHVPSPAGLSELNAGMKEVMLCDITDIPFAFIPGVKTVSDSLEDADMMRGEEAELFGISNKLFANYAYILPGSHSKIITLDSLCRIRSIRTMLTGEMIYSLSQHTILKDTVDLSSNEIDTEYLRMGHDYCRKNGINEALFKVRILDRLFKCNKVQTYSFFTGAVLCEEIKKIIELDPDGIVIGGKEQLKNAVSELLTYRTNKKIIKIDPERVKASSALGAVKIYEYGKDK